MKFNIHVGVAPSQSVDSFREAIQIAKATAKYYNRNVKVELGLDNGAIQSRFYTVSPQGQLDVGQVDWEAEAQRKRQLQKWDALEVLNEEGF